jgi:hypothetical protein
MNLTSGEHSSSRFCQRRSLHTNGRSTAGIIATRHHCLMLVFSTTAPQRVALTGPNACDSPIEWPGCLSLDPG